LEVGKRSLVTGLSYAFHGFHFRACVLECQLPTYDGMHLLRPETRGVHSFIQQTKRKKKMKKSIAIQEDEEESFNHVLQNITQ
jgi:hypothetical protein